MFSSLPYRSSSNLSALNCMLFFLCHSYMVSRSFWSEDTSWADEICLLTRVSSANDDTFASTLVLMSAMRIKNRIGPNTVPWGTLLSTLACAEVWPSTLTAWSLSARKLWSHIPNFPVIPKLLSLWHRVLYNTHFINHSAFYNIFTITIIITFIYFVFKSNHS